MFVLNILCHNLLGTNQPEGWVRTDWKWVRNVWAWVRKIHGYETTGYLQMSCVILHNYKLRGQPLVSNIKYQRPKLSIEKKWKKTAKTHLPSPALCISLELGEFASRSVSSLLEATDVQPWLLARSRLTVPLPCQHILTQVKIRSRKRPK